MVARADWRGKLGRKNSVAGRDRELPVQEELDAHTFPTNVRVVGDAWGILAATNSFALLSTRPFKKKPLPRPSNLGGPTWHEIRENQHSVFWHPPFTRSISPLKKRWKKFLVVTTYRSNVVRNYPKTSAPPLLHCTGPKIKF